MLPKAIHFLQTILWVSLCHGLNNHHKFLDKIVSRVEETVQKFESIFNINHANEKSNSDETTDPKLWAVLVAGSNGYYNYRHQV